MENDIFNIPAGMDDQEEDVCRVCRLEEEPDNPMVHPCKCSGSVRYVHPDCLKNWLAASQKKTCEICGYRYAFTKVYPDHIPEIIPPDVYLRQTLRSIYKVAQYISRCWLVVITWLIVLPLANMAGLKTYAWFTDYAITGLHTTGTTRSNINATSAINATLLDAIDNSTANVTTANPFPNYSPPTLILNILAGLFRLLFPQLPRSTSPSSTMKNSSTLPLPSSGSQARSYTLGATFDVPSPYYVFQGQILSVALGAMIIALIFLREWYASYNWAQHDKHKAHVEEVVIPEEWVVKRGVTERKYTKLPNGTLVSIRAERRKKAREIVERIKAAEEADWEEIPDGEEETIARKREGLHSLASGAPGMASFADQQSAAAGPGPSTAAFRASVPSQDPIIRRMQIPTSEQEAESVKHLQRILLRARELRNSRPIGGFPDKRVADVAWKAPELLVDAKEKEDSTSIMAERDEVAPSDKILSTEVEGPKAEDIDLEELRGSSNPESGVEADNLVPPATTLPSATKPTEVTTPESLNSVPTLGMRLNMTTDSSDKIFDDPLRGLISSILALQYPSPTDLTTVAGIFAFTKWSTQISVDLHKLNDRHDALNQDAQKVYARGLAGEELSPEYMMREMALVDTRRNDLTADMGRVKQRAQALTMLKLGYKAYMPEIMEIHAADRSMAGLADAQGPGGAEEMENPPSIAQPFDAAHPSHTGDDPSLDVGIHVDQSSSDTLAAISSSDDLIGANDTAPSENLENVATENLDDTQTTTVPEAEAEAQPSSSTDGGETSMTQPKSALQHAIENAEGNNASMERILANAEDPGLRRELVKLLEVERKAGEKEVERVRRREAGLDEGEEEGDDSSETGAEEGMIGAADLDKPEEQIEVPREEAAQVIAKNLREEADDTDSDVELNEEDLALERADNAAQLAEEGIVMDDEEEGGWAAEDMDQMLEVVGLIGPVGALFQNLVLAIAVMGAAMTCFVFTPMSVGKVVLYIDPIRSILKAGTITWDLGRAFLHWSRFITDPVIDMGIEIGRDAILKPFFAAFVALEHIAATKLGLESREMPSTRYIGYYHHIIESYHQATVLAEFMIPPKQKLWTPSIYTLVIPKIIANRSQYIPSSIPIVLNLNPVALVEAVENLGSKSYKAYEAYRILAMRLATGHTLADGIACLVVGYASTLGSMTILAWQAEQGTFKVLGKDWKQGLKRYRLSAKLVMFLALELVAFPLGAGALIAICTIPVLPHQSRWGKIGDMKDTVFGMLFITWLIGTMFMYGFAQVLSWCRSFCRPGALYFIRDPHDPNYSPVKEIINRSTGAQFRKLGISTLMYSFLIWWLFGAIPWSITLLGSKALLPLRLDGFGPLSPIPFDYLFLLVAVPPTLVRLRPQHTVKRILFMYWRTFERILRLDPLLNLDKTKNRSILTQRSVGKKETIFWRILDIPFQLVFGKYDPVTTFARVPAHDRVILLAVKKNGTPKRVGMFVRLDKNGQPKTSDDKVKMIRQDLLARRAERDPATDFRIAHLPEYWRTRIHIFILVLLMGAGLALASSVLGPIILGRAILEVYVGKVHDGYSFLVGAYSIYAATIAGLRAYKIIISFGRATQKRGSGRQARVKRFIVNNLSRAISLLAIFLIHPILKGLVWEIRVGLLVRYGFGYETSVIHLWDAWALGAVLNSIELGACGLFRDRDGDPTFHDVHNLWRRPFKHGLLELGKILLPEYGSLLVNLVLPFAYTFLFYNARGLIPDFSKTNFRIAGLASWAIRAMVVRIKTVGPRFAAYRQRVIDAEYVVEERVQNYEPDEPESKVDTTKTEVQAYAAADGSDEGMPPLEDNFEGTDVNIQRIDLIARMARIAAGELDEEQAWEDPEEEEEEEYVAGGYNGLLTSPLKDGKFPGEGQTLGGPASESEVETAHRVESSHGGDRGKEEDHDEVE